MRKLIMLLTLLPIFVSAFDSDINRKPSPDRPICGGLSDFRCINRPVDSICLRNAQKAIPGLCRIVDEATTDEDKVFICTCI